MTSEIKTNINAVELSDNELDTVAGGLAIAIGDVQGYAQSAANDFFQKNLTVAQQTFAGPGGSGTASVTNLQAIGSSAGQSIVIS
ncbi:CTB family bacteriocin [Leptolyngbya sp. GGD]|uniref:CTB family bacteriocin n=1 Tax=Leptolyngbya sp. GGD TaxID=2997907 RepID=UPI00227C76C0|nr:CTB family bacteriocin [Leptolyngbya sp. GGD]MCY6493879.1 CTB family bacteriocin [Leptolyngbya sp. GGD]